MIFERYINNKNQQYMKLNFLKKYLRIHKFGIDKLLINLSLSETFHFYDKTTLSLKVDNTFIINKRGKLMTSVAVLLPFRSTLFTHQITFRFFKEL